MIAILATAIILISVLAGVFYYSSAKNSPGNFSIIVKQTGGAGLMIGECADKNYINGTADYVIEGVVENVESRWNEDRTLIFTYTNLSINKYLKGIPFKIASTNLQIITPGGTVDGITQAVEDQPIFHKGKAVRIYFKNYSGEFSIVCGSLGVEDLY